MSEDWRDEFCKLITEVDPKSTGSSFHRANLLKIRHLPSALFKYREVNDYSLDNLDRDLVWLAAADTFNDPYDCSVAMDHERLLRYSIVNRSMSEKQLPGLTADVSNVESRIAKHIEAGMGLSEAMSALIAEDGVDPQLAPAAGQELIAAYLSVMRERTDTGLQSMQSGVKVCSFSASPVDVSLLMWGHYARWHEGFCIRYRVADFNNPSLLHPVLYSMQRFDLTPYFESMLDGSLNIRLAHAAALFKHPAWGYEAEWRLFAPLGEGEYAKGIAVSVPTPEAVYLGSKISQDNKRKVLEIVSRRRIDAFQMELSRNEFRLNPTRCN